MRFKNDEKLFLFHLKKNPFRSQDIYNLALDFFVLQKKKKINNHAKNEAERLVPVIFKNSYMRCKWSSALFQYISIALNLAYNKNKLYKTLDYWSRHMHNLILQKRVSTIFCAWFSREMFLMLYSINCPNFIACLSLILEILVNMCIAVVCLTRLTIKIY